MIMRIARYALTALLLVFIVVIYMQGMTPAASIEEVQQAYEAAAAEQAGQPADANDAAEGTEATEGTDAEGTDAEATEGTEAAEGDASAAEGLLDNLTLQDARSVERFLGISDSLYEGILYWKSDYAMIADELCIVRASSEDAVAEIQSCLEQRVEDQKTVFEGYAPEEAAKVESYTYKARGEYVFFAIGDRSAEWEQVFDGLQ